MDTCYLDGSGDRPRSRRSPVQALLIGTIVVACCCVFGVRLLGDELNSTTVYVAAPVVSPLADKVAFVLTHESDTDIKVQLSIVSVEDGNTMHTGAKVLHNSPPMTWNIDQSRIAFVSGRGRSLAGKLLMGLDSIELSTCIVSQIAPPRVHTPQYSPKGTYLAYVSNHDLIVEELQTQQQNRIQSGVDNHHWCWGPNEKELFYIRDDFNVCKFDLPDGSERVLFTATPSDDGERPGHLVSSPDGSQLGYHIDGWFHTIDLASGITTRRFKCDHYFLDFDWNPAGICFVDGVDGEWRKKAKVKVFDPITEKASVIVTGPFSYPRWLGKSKILVRKGNAELWVYPVGEGKAVRLFGPPKATE